MTSDKITGAVVARAGGKDYRIVFDLDACDYLHDNGIDPWGEGFANMIERMKPKEIRLVIHAGLKRHHPDVTLEEIGRFRLGQFLGPIAAAYRAQMSPDEEADDTPSGPPEADDSRG